MARHSATHMAGNREARSSRKPARRASSLVTSRRAKRNIAAVADWLLIPVIPTVLSQQAYDQVLDFFRRKRVNDKHILSFFSMVENRKKMHQTLIQELGEHDPHFLKTVIPYSVNVENMGLHREPIGVYAPRSPSAHAYQNLWNELEQQLLVPTSS